MRSRSVHFRRSTGMKAFGSTILLLWAGVAFFPAYGQEPGQTPRPPASEVREPTEEELVRLDKDYPSFAALKDDAPYAYSGKKQMDAIVQKAANDEEKAFEYVVAFAHKQPMERLRKFSFRDVPIENLYRPIRQDYLRDLIHVDGYLALILTMRPTKDLKDLYEINQLYEAWVAVRGPSSTKTICVVVSELPEGVSPGENQNVKVSFDAYYFKLWHYETRAVKDAKDPEKKQWERAPLFIGRSFDVKGPATAAESAYTPGMLIGLVGGLAALVLAGAGMAIWFRRGDKNIRTAARQKIESSVSFENNPDPDASGPVNRISYQF